MKKTICPVLSLFMVFVLGSIGLCGPLNSPIKTLSLEQIRKSAQAESGEMVQFLSRTIQYPSVENSGEGVTPETAALLSFVLTYAQNMGFNVRKAANGMAGVLEYGEGKESVGVLVHLDVVPVSDHERPQWTHPPFSGRITDREVWGRGAQDNKGALASGKTDQFYGLSGPLEMDIGLQDYNSFVAENTLEGISKGDLVLFSKGISAHGSTPWTGKNAVVAVALVGSRMSQLSENAYKRAFKFVTAKIGMSTDGSGLGIPFTLSSQLPPVLPGMTPIQYLGTSANLGLVTEEGDQLVLSMNFRTGFVNTNEQLLEASRMSAAVFGGTAEYVKGDGSHYEPFYYTKDQPLLNLVINAYKQVYPAYPEYTPYVFLTPGSTYLKLVSNFVNLGPVDLFPDPSANYFHAKNEHTTIKGQVGNMILYAHTLQKMVQMETAPVR
ncbi:MAG: M20/M25/M40 family metallo-hydrolase [Proteobacteria bacterium]|nr:M20/M25/M40 family metallo-hydrolase [Pseudomonadota bacterium]